MHGESKRLLHCPIARFDPGVLLERTDPYEVLQDRFAYAMTAHPGNIVPVTASLERSKAVRRPINFLERFQFLHKHLVMLGLPCGQFLETRFSVGSEASWAAFG